MLSFIQMSCRCKCVFQGSIQGPRPSGILIVHLCVFQPNVYKSCLCIGVLYNRMKTEFTLMGLIKYCAVGLVEMLMLGCFYVFYNKEFISVYTTVKI